jgi:hypothetical protein
MGRTADRRLVAQHAKAAAQQPDRDSAAPEHVVPVNQDELDALRARIRWARSLEKLPLPEPDMIAERFPYIPMPWDAAEQCLPTALAACLRLPVHQVPPRRDHEELDEWDKKVEESLGVRLEHIGHDEEPPRAPWIAILPTGDDETTHAVAVIGNAAVVRGRLAGFRIVPA